MRWRVITSISFCLTCWSNSCSRPLKKLRPIGNSLLRQATFRLLCGSNLFFSRFLPARLPSVGGGGTALDEELFLDWLGMIRAILSISFPNTKFCSSLLNIYNHKRFIFKNQLLKLQLHGPILSILLRKKHQDILYLSEKSVSNLMHILLRIWTRGQTVLLHNWRVPQRPWWGASANGSDGDPHT